MRTCIFVAALLLAPLVTYSAEQSRDNARLVEIFKADQQARQNSPIDWSVVAVQDRAHRAEVLEMIRAGRLLTANDHFHAAMVFQHGDSIEDYRLAFSLSHIGATLDPEHKGAKWLSAASWDRILMTKNVPQWYGTQYHRPEPDGPMLLYEVDESVVSDNERKGLNVPTLQESKDRLLRINR